LTGAESTDHGRWLGLWILSLPQKRWGLHFSLPVYASKTQRHESCHDLQQPQKGTSTVPRPRQRLVLQPAPSAVHGHVAVSLGERSFLPHLVLKLTTSSNTLLTNSLQTAALNTPPSQKILFRFSTLDKSRRASHSVIAL
jgi:hypothetical protein